jgi:hypothetical protein
MKSKEYPNVLKRFTHKASLDLDNEGIAHVLLTCDHDFPPVCIKKVFPDHTPKLIFPSGKYEGWFTYPELRTVEEHDLGEITKVYETFEWKETFNPFKKYVDYFYKRKEEATLQNSPRKNLYKIILNGTYGKFGEHGLVKLLSFDGDKIDSITEMKQRNAWYHSVPIASYITAYARLENWQYLRTIKPKHMYYTDTDCFATSDNLDVYCGSKLGQLKLEGTSKPYNSCFIRAKFYKFNDDIKLKGFSVPEQKGFLEMAIYRNDFSRQEHRILKVLDAQRLKQIPLTDCYVTKTFSVEPDGKRVYDSELLPKDLLFSQTMSKPLLEGF